MKKQIKRAYKLYCPNHSISRNLHLYVLTLSNDYYLMNRIEKFMLRFLSLRKFIEIMISNKSLNGYIHNVYDFSIMDVRLVRLGKREQ